MNSRSVSPPPNGPDLHGPTARPRRRLRGWRASRLKFCAISGLTLLEGGRAFFPALIARIDAAESVIRLETYIYCDDKAGQSISAALIRAAQRGVDVRVITDGVGTARLPLFEQWSAAGIQHRIFNPHLFGAAGVARDHRKVCAIDQRAAFVGGINIIDDMMHDGHVLDAPRWDFSVEMLGPVVRDVILAFDAQWTRVDPERQGAGRFWPESWRPDRRRIRQQLERDLRVQTGSVPQAIVDENGQGKGPPLKPPGSEPQVAFVARDNRLNRRAIERAYLYAIGRATRTVVLANPYFTPGRRLRRALNRAARRGVDVKLLIGRKEFRLLDWAVPSLYGSLLRAGVQIAEYDKAMLHGKVAVVDEDWGTVGSSNLDALSLFLNHEANVVMVRDPVVADLHASIVQAFDGSRRIDQRRYALRRWPERLLNWAAYGFYRLAMRVLTIGRYD